MKRLSIGDYKGVPINTVPTDYLVFLATRPKVKADQRKIAVDELIERG